MNRPTSLKYQSLLTKGFTLIELVSVLVIVGIVVAIGSNFVVSTVNSYGQTEKRSKLVARGRASLEQMTRQLRNALPNSLRVSASGNCIEYLPVIGGANYIGQLADTQNGASATSSISTSPFNLDLGSAQHVVVAALSTSELYTGAATAARADIGTLGSSPYTTVPLAIGHRFVRNSVNNRLFISDDPKRFCFVSGSIVQYQNYGLDTGNLDDSNPGGDLLTLSEGIFASGNVFVLSAGSQDRNTAVTITLGFAERGEQITLDSKVLVRNVP
ncbi:MSHA biogenesis protein MshO [Alteromonadaceae bacterium Bs31]|nr:MSHA biogenesis protein MshO [Alteromonadaceae bacterium Bs31]